MEAEAIVIRTASDFNELEVVKVGTKQECFAYLAENILPNGDTRRVKKLKCDSGRMFSVEKRIYGNVIGGEWKRFKYMIQFIY